MTDKGFYILPFILGQGGAGVWTPTKLRKAGERQAVQEAQQTKDVANMRIHVERWVERIRNWRILSGTIEISTVDLLSDLVCVLAMLQNWQEGVLTGNVTRGMEVDEAAEQ
jgi:hypothetical protein